MSVNHKCVDCGIAPAPDAHAILLVQSVTIGKRVVTWEICSRCFLRRGVQEQAEMREQLERSMKAKAKVAS